MPHRPTRRIPLAAALAAACLASPLHAHDRADATPPAAATNDAAATTDEQSATSAVSAPVLLLRLAIDRGERWTDAQRAAAYEVAVASLLTLEPDAMTTDAKSRLADAYAATQDQRDAADRAATLRVAMDDVIEMLAPGMDAPVADQPDDGFEVLLEAPLPAGFPDPGPVGRVVVKTYPAHRIARSDGRNAFGNLFRHITSNDVAMTTPVEMTMEPRANGRGMAQVAMGFYYEAPDQGEAGDRGAVDVIDEPELTVLSIGLRGEPNAGDIAAAVSQLQDALAERADAWQAAGPTRLMGYNSPFVPDDRKFFELQLPVERLP